MPQIQPGIFTCSQHAEIVDKSENFIRNPRHLNHINEPIHVAACLLEAQTATMNPLMDQRGVCASMKITFMGICDDTPVTDGKVSDCEVDGDERVGSFCKTFEPNIFFHDSFCVLEKDCDRNNLYGDLIEKFALEEASLLSKFETTLVQRLVAFFDSNADTFDIDDIECHFDVPITIENGNCITISGAFWDSSIMGEFDYFAKQLKMNNYITISGKNFQTEAFKAQYAGQFCCNNSDVLKDTRFNFCFDSHNLDSFLQGRYTFLVDPSSYVFWSTSENTNEAPEFKGNDTEIYRTKLPRLKYRDGNKLKDIWVDVQRQRKCDEGNWGWAARYQLCAGLHLTVDDCDGKHGIVKFGNGCATCP